MTLIYKQKSGIIENFNKLPQLWSVEHISAISVSEINLQIVVRSDATQ